MISRRVVLGHPNSWICAAFRKKVLRQSGKPFAGNRTIGELGSTDDEDEPDVDWEDLGYGAMLLTEAYQPGLMVSTGTAVDDSVVSITALIESEAEPGKKGYFETKKHDVVYVLPAEGIAVAYEVVDVVGMLDVPPYVVRYVLNKRDALGFVAAFRLK